MSDIVTLARRHKHVAPTHYEGCEVDHIGCLVNRLADEIEGLRAENERLKRDSDEAREESKPVQEPVAWRNKKWGYFTVNPIASKHTDWEPLYTAQRPRQLRNALEGKP